ncbi:MAG TPA: AlkA N-terminal domain-containing protein [Thermoleophilaceae bacterium]|nr:AlkA N-terminal domain-containing protein [Thermoleophilaceae bacterium]
MGESTVWIQAAEPFDGASVLGFLEARAVASVEEVKGGSYRRSVSLKNGGGVVSVRPEAAGVRVELELDDAADAEEALARVRRLFDVEADPAPIGAVLGADPLLRPLVRERPGLRVPGAMDGFEIAVRAIVGQQVSVAGARTVLGRLVERFGAPVAGGPPSGGVLFPAPDALADADPASFPFPRARGAALVELARLVAAGELRLEPDADLPETRSRLLAIPGIGPWTVSYIAMRALGDPDAFPRGDVALLRALAALDGPADPDRWRPWRSYAVMHLWRSLGA